jgi:hypothetical protein
MKKTLLIFLLSIWSALNLDAFAQTTSLTVFDQILFYDGYAGVVNHPVPEGVIRHRNDLYAKKLTAAQLLAFGSNMTLNVTIKADCDNYDRIGNVNLALVPKDAVTYVPNNVQRFELARFITPFMNKNISPYQVPYTFSIDNVAKLFKDPTINALYDIWIEFEVFGVPYAAQTQVAGCSGINSVFFGTLELVSNTTALTSANNFLLPLNFKKNLNNYQAGASDAIGQTVRTIVFDLPSGVNNASFYLITSNHGANSGGEEYNRRWHYIFFDNMLFSILSYKPGELTCEPYRVYNTQANGIYGASPMSNLAWQSFSNWCPGAKIPIRKIDLGNLSSGSHTFRISVPTAVFNGAQGYFPISLYLQGTNAVLGLESVNKVEYSVYPNPSNDFINIETLDKIKNISVSNTLGQKVYQGTSNQINISNFSKGMYLMQVEFDNNITVTEKIIKN